MTFGFLLTTVGKLAERAEILRAVHAANSDERSFVVLGARIALQPHDSSLGEHLLGDPPLRDVVPRELVQSLRHPCLFEARGAQHHAPAVPRVPPVVILGGGTGRLVAAAGLLAEGRRGRGALYGTGREQFPGVFRGSGVFLGVGRLLQDADGVDFNT